MGSAERHNQDQVTPGDSTGGVANGPEVSASVELATSETSMMTALLNVNSAVPLTHGSAVDAFKQHAVSLYGNANLGEMSRRDPFALNASISNLAVVAHLLSQKPIQGLEVITSPARHLTDETDKTKKVLLPFPPQYVHVIKPASSINQPSSEHHMRHRIIPSGGILIANAGFTWRRKTSPLHTVTESYVDKDSNTPDTVTYEVKPSSYANTAIRIHLDRKDPSHQTVGISLGKASTKDSIDYKVITYMVRRPKS